MTRLLVLLAACAAGLPAARGQTETSGWLLRASQLQRFLGYDVRPVDTHTYAATHNSYSSDMTPATHSYFEIVTNQRYDLYDQLNCLGVRGIEIDIHFITELAADDNDASALRVCHAGSTASEQAYQLCSNIGWKTCNACGVPDFGPTATTCRADAPTFRTQLLIISEWLNLPGNSKEFLVVKLESYSNGHEQLISDEIGLVIGAERVYSAEEFVVDGAVWPTVGDLVARGKNIVFASILEQSTLVLAMEEHVVKPNQLTLLCNGLYPTGFNRAQGDAVSIQLTVNGDVLFSDPPDPTNFLSAELVPEAMNCGFIPTFDRLDPPLLASTIWSWAENAPAQPLPPPNTCAVANALTNGRWTDVPCLGDQQYYYACVAAADRGAWSVSAGQGGGLGGDVPVCAAGSVFGAPTSAVENALLVAAMNQAGVLLAWVNVHSNAFGCWIAEEGRPYCLGDGDIANIPSDATCGAAPVAVPPVPTDICFKIKTPWNEGDYAPPAYTPPRAAVTMHSWARIRGDNSWDLGSDYYVGVACAAIPFALLGLVLAFVVMPAVGYCACGQRRRHYSKGAMAVSAADTHGATRVYRTWVFALFSACCVITMAAAVTALVGSYRLDEDLTIVRHELDHAAGLMIDAHEAAVKLDAALNTTQTDLAELSTCDAKTDFETSIKQVGGDLASAGDSVKAFIAKNFKGLGDDIMVVSHWVASTHMIRVIIGVIVSAIIIFITASYIGMASWVLSSVRRGSDHTAVMRVKRSLRFSKWVLLPVSILLVVCSWVSAGLITTVGLVAADICVDPRQNIVHAFTNDVIADTARYYVTCDGTNVFAQLIEQGFLFTFIAKGELNSANFKDYAQQCPALAPAKDRVAAALANIKDETGYLSKEIRCREINPMYVQGVEGAICTSGTQDILMAMVGFVLVGIFLALVSTCFIWLMRHVGYAESDRLGIDFNSSKLLQRKTSTMALPPHTAHSRHVSAAETGVSSRR